MRTLPRRRDRLVSDWVARSVVLLVALASVTTRAAAQKNTCSSRRPMVDAVEFAGLKHLPADVVENVVVTERTSVWRRWFGWNVGVMTCLDTSDVNSDAKNLETEYRARGYIAATVKGLIERHGDRRARVIYRVNEGRPVAITSVTIVNLPKDAADSAAAVKRLIGQPLDDSIVSFVADSLQGLLRDAGHARAAPRQVSFASDSATYTASVRLTFTPGPLTYIDTVVIHVTPSGASSALRDRTYREAFGIHRGDQYSARRIANGERELSNIDLYKQIRVDTASAPGANGASRDTLRLDLTLVEADRRRARTTGGWGTLDCFRTQSKYTEQNFGGLGERLELNGRLSKIGIAEPFTGLQSLCSGTVRNDPFSQHLNYYVSASVRFRGLPDLWRARWQPEVTVFSERRSAVGVYEQTTELGLLGTSTHTLGERLTATAQYTFTDSRTNADRAVSCTRFGFCRLEDVAGFLARTPEHTIGGTLAKNPLQPTDDPSSGGRWSVDAKYGHASIGGTIPIDFGRFTVEAAAYRELTPWLTLALRAEIGAVVAPAGRESLIPPSERFYGGGQNSVRGYGQNLLGPGSYIVTAIDTVTGADGKQYGVADSTHQPSRIAPSGGNAMWIANVELRTRRGWPSDLLHWVVFVDAGRVWSTRDIFSTANAVARATPGFGVRLVTKLGVFRMDAGYNPNGVDPGPAFFVQSGDIANGIPGRAICVSRGTDDPLVLGAGQSPSSSSCPASYLPPKTSGILSRFTFHFSLGNAF